MRQRIITAAIRRCAFAICKAAVDLVLAADRCAMRMSCHLFHARHAFAASANRSNSSSNKRSSDGLRGNSGCLQTATTSLQAAAYRSATQSRPASTQAWRVRPMQVVRGLAPVALG